MKKLKYNRNKKDIFNDLPMLLGNIGVMVEKEVCNLNRGGCCVYASLVARKIKRFFPFITVGLKVCEDMSDKQRKKIYNIRPQISNNTPKNWSNQHIHFSHVVIMLKYNGTSVFLDSESISYDKKYFKFKGSDKTFHIGCLTIKEGLELAQSDDWNNAFNRAQIPLLKRIINTEFKKIVRRFYD